MPKRDAGKAQLGWLLACLLLTACRSGPPIPPGSSRAEERQKIAALDTQLGIEYMREGNNEIALERLEKALTVDPNYVDAHNALGLLYSQLREYDLAEKSFKSALRTDPGNSFALNNYGQFLCQQKRYPEGQLQFAAAVKNPLYDTPEAAYTNAGLCALDAQDNKAAEDYFRAALGSNPEMRTALLAMAQISLDRPDVIEANRYLARYLRDAPQTPRTLALGIRIERELKHPDKVASYELMLRNQFPDSRETGQLLRGEL